jgi:hypothetical protein
MLITRCVKCRASTSIFTVGKSIDLCIPCTQKRKRSRIRGANQQA